MNPATPLHALSARALLHALSTGQLSSVEAVRALSDRSDAVDGEVGALIHSRRAEALVEAEAADRARASGATLGPLHGLPVTVKENLATAGLPVTLGLRSRLEPVIAEDCVMVQALRQAGAIVLAKSNVPLFLLSMECDNEIFGTTSNPWDLARSPGGSSGGEGAAIATGQSPLGLGTDIGGSIRIPAAWCGVPGLKPTLGRWSSVGQHGIPAGQEVVRSSAGPLARRVADLTLAMTALAPERLHQLDPRVPPLPIGDVDAVPVAALRVGYYEDDGFFTPAAAIRRAVREAAAALSDAGVEVVPYQPPKAWEIMRDWMAALSADGGQTLIGALGDQAPTPALRGLLQLARVPAPLRRGLAALAGSRGEARMQMFLRAFGEKSVARLWALTAQRTAYQREEMAAWRAQGLDAVLGPATVTPAALKGQTGDWALGAVHTMRSNLLDLPAGVQPVSRVRPEDALRAEAGDRLEQKAARFEAGSVGLPVSVQVCGRPWEEDRVLALMAVIEAAAMKSPDYPVTPIDPRRPGETSPAR